VGKTAVATALARLQPIGCIAADSRQIYRGLDIGTAKPDATDRAAAPHFGLDVVDPAERYSAGRFARDAAGWIAAIEADGRTPVVVGGTGFYLRALFEGLFVEPPLERVRRERLQEALRGLSAEALQRWAQRLDPGYRGGGHQRAARAVEIALLTGTPLSTHHRASTGAAAVRGAVYVRLTLERGALAARIRARTAAMLAAGLVDEVRRLLASGVPSGAPGLSGVGYREAVAHLEGRLSADRLLDAISTATRQYAKRQETWFRHQLPPDTLVLDATPGADALADAALRHYRALTSDL
jgi:tRNA dimethylallyltransferase